MTVQGSFGEQPLTAENQLEQLNRIWLPLLKRMLTALNASMTVSDSAPVSPATGNLWYDSSGLQLYLWDGTAWVAV